MSLRALGHPGLHVIAHDPDIVTEANLGRQLFAPGDVGCNKADVLINRINLFHGLDWKANRTRYYGNHPDILIGCVDTIASRREIARSGYTYWLDLGNTDKTGQVVLGAHPTLKTQDPRPKTFFELFPELRRKRKEDNAPSCSLAGALERQDLFINQAVATAALNLLWQLVRHGSIHTNGCYINLNNGSQRPIPLP